jgi:DNA polymerase I-like protein with 3'-5' exonuclease and polymerase domains
MAQKLLEGAHYINYNLFGTVTGRLTTFPESFPVLTSQRGFRQLIKPRNDWFLSLDYNGAEVRTLMALSQQAQPTQDIHEWNVKNIFDGSVTREEAKTLLFSWLYNPDSDAIETAAYDRERVLEEWYDQDYILTPFGRRIKVEKRKALNYLIQSTTADLVIERAVVVDKMLEGKKSFVSHIVHDELVIDMADEDREMIPQIRDTFADNRIGNYLVNLRAGKNYLDLKDLSL